MMSLNLSDFLSGHVFAFLLIFSRLGGAFMLFPGLGESFVPARVRMMFALIFSFMVMPVLLPHIPALPQQIPDMALLIFKEVLVGVFFGSIMRLLMDVVETMGSLFSMQVGLSSAMVLNPSLGSQSALTGAFLSSAGLALLFVTGLDHFLFRALMDTYKIFPFGGELYIADMVQTFIHVFSKSFMVGIQLSMPFMVAGLLFYAVLGIMQRSMPQLQLFLVVMPVQIVGGFFLFVLVMAVGLGVWLKFCDATVGSVFIR